jgi:hypothetical protein
LVASQCAYAQIADLNTTLTTTAPETATTALVTREVAGRASFEEDGGVRRISNHQQQSRHDQ